MVQYYLANFGGKQPAMNGQVHKSLAVRRLLLQREPGDLHSLDVGMSWLNSFKVLFLRRSDKLYVSLGRKGLVVVSSLLFLRYVIGFPLKNVTLVVVGGWLPEYAISAAKRTMLVRCFKSILVETSSLKRELKTIGVDSDILVNFRFSEPLPSKELSSEVGIRLVFCSRVTEDKGIFLAIELLQALNMRGINATLDVYGPVANDISQRFKSAVQSLPQVAYKGTYEGEKRAVEIISAYDFLVLPTSYPGECMPGVVIESFCAGTPVITTDWRHMSELVENGVTGYVCELSNFVKEATGFICSISGKSYQEISSSCVSTYSKIYFYSNAKIC